MSELPPLPGWGQGKLPRDWATTILKVWKSPLSDRMFAEIYERYVRTGRWKDSEWVKVLEQIGVSLGFKRIDIMPYVDLLARVLEPITHIFYTFEIMIFTGFIFEEAAQIYGRLALKYLCPLAITRLVTEFLPRIATVVAQIRYSVEAPGGLVFPGADALQRYADAMEKLQWAIEQIATKEGIPIDEYWYEGNIKEYFIGKSEEELSYYDKLIKQEIENYEKMFGFPPEW